KAPDASKNPLSRASHVAHNHVGNPHAVRCGKESSSTEAPPAARKKNIHFTAANGNGKRMVSEGWFKTARMRVSSRISATAATVIHTMMILPTMSCDGTPV